MNNTEETVGLRVLSYFPCHHDNNVKVNTNIDIIVSSDINPASFVNNIVILED